MNPRVTEFISLREHTDTSQATQSGPSCIKNLSPVGTYQMTPADEADDHSPGDGDLTPMGDSVSL